MIYQLRFYTAENEYEGLDIQSFTHTIQRQYGRPTGAVEYSLQTHVAANSVEDYERFFNIPYEKISIVTTSVEMIELENGEEEEQSTETEKFFEGYALNRIQYAPHTNLNNDNFILIEFLKR